MAFTHLTLTGSIDQGDLMWFVVDSTTGDTMALGGSAVTTKSEDQLIDSLKRQIEPAPDDSRKKIKKSVRFELSAPVPIYSPIEPTATKADALIPNDSMRKDFCDLIRRRLREPLQGSECVCVLNNTDSCKHYVYPSLSKSYDHRRQAISLGHLISAREKGHKIGKILLYDRLHLAKTLPIAVLQYHATPWLTMSWRSKDVYFFGNDNNPMQELLSLASPHLNVRVKGPNGQLSGASAFPTNNLVRNPLLFSLGIVLLEIAHSSTFESLQRPSDLQNGRGHQYTEFFAARRLAKLGNTDMGGRYHRIVEQLVECDFGCGADLSSAELQTAFHNDVICPLERLEQKLHDFHFDD